MYFSLSAKKDKKEKISNLQKSSNADLEKYLFSQREFLQNSSFKNAKKSSQQLNNTYSHLTYDV